MIPSDTYRDNNEVCVSMYLFNLVQMNITHLSLNGTIVIGSFIERGSHPPLGCIAATAGSCTPRAQQGPNISIC